MVKKTAIVTGSSSGFGLLCSLKLAKNGFRVISTMRDPQKAGSLLNLAKKWKVEDSLHVFQLDVTSEESIDHFKESLKNYDSIDVLVNNAGFALGGFAEDLSIEVFRSQFETNFFGAVAITQLVLPFMRAQNQGRIINMSSISGRMGFPGLSPYVASKHAFEGFSECLRLEVKPFGIDVVLVEPGSYNTNIWSVLDSIESSHGSAYDSYLTAILTEIKNGKPSFGDPMEVAELVVQIATLSKNPKMRYPIGQGVKKNLFLKAILPWNFLEKAIIKKLKQ